MNIDATNLIVGRLATYAAKQALLGNEIRIFNCEKAIITGRKEVVIEKYKRLRTMGTVRKGPFFPRKPDMFVKRIIRGMLPYKQEKGRNAFNRIMCYVGVPAVFSNEKAETIKNADVSKMLSKGYGSVGKICKELGG